MVEFAKKAWNTQSSAESVARSGRLSAPFPISIMQLAVLQEHALSKGNILAILELAATLTELSKWAPTSLPPSARKTKNPKKQHH